MAHHRRYRRRVSPTIHTYITVVDGMPPLICRSEVPPEQRCNCDVWPNAFEKIEFSEITSTPFNPLAPQHVSFSTVGYIIKGSPTALVDAPECDACGSITVRSGSCWKCLNCGNSMKAD